MKWIILLACLLPGFAAAEIFKCTSPDGRVDYRDIPCESKADREETITPPPPQGLDKLLMDRDELDRRYEERKQERIRHYSMRRARNGLSLGMTESEVRALDHFGFPDDLNSTETAYGSREQWVYETDPDNEYEHMYLYFDDGVLTAIQD